MTTQRRQDLLAVLLLVLLPTLLFADVLFGSKNFYLGDITRFHYPMKKIVREIIRHGEFPYWNRDISAGQPLAANPQHEVFYPPNWLIFLPDYDLGFRLQVLLHVYIAAIGMFALLRSMTLSLTASLFGAISFAFGGAFLSYGSLLPFFYSVAWMPWTCLASRKFLITGRPRAFALAAMFLALQLLIGEPTTIAQTMLLVALYAVYRRRDGFARNAGGVALIAVVALLLAAVQVVPMIDHVRDSVRSEPFPYEVVASWSMPPAKLAELLFPNLLGHISIHGVPWYWGGTLYRGTGLPFVLNIYCGLAAVALAAGGLAARIRGWAAFASLFMTSIAFALGGYTPLLRALYDARLVTSIRYPEKFILLGVFSLIVFAAHALDRAMAGERRVAEAAAGFAMAAGLIAGAVSLLGYVPYSVDGFLSAFGLPATPGTLLMIARAWADWSIAGVRALALLLFLLTIYTKRRSAWSLAALLFVCADLYAVVRELNPRVDRTFFTERPQLAGALPDERQTYRIYHEADWHLRGGAAGAFFRSGLQSYWMLRNGLFPLVNVEYGIASVIDRDYDKTALLSTTEFVRAAGEISQAGRADWRSPLMAMSNAWYRTVFNSFVEEERQAEGDVRKVLPVAFVEHSHQPRYYFADQIVSVASRAEFVQRMISATFSSSVAFINAPAFQPAAGVVNDVRETANDAVLDVTAAGRGFLVMSVTPHKYWRITIDGTRAAAITTNIGYQGVVVPQGRHRITMSYRNTLIPAGAAISMITMASLAAVALRWRTA